MRAFRSLLLLLLIGFPAGQQTHARSKADEVTLDFGPSLQQPDGVTCGPTCAVMVLNYYGINAGIGPVAECSDTNWLNCCEDWHPGGINIGLTLPMNLANCMKNRHGLKVDVRKGTAQDLRDVVSMRKPAILLVRSARYYWHYITVTGYRTHPAQFRIHDTNNSVYWMDESDLLGIWRFSHEIGPLSGDRMLAVYVEDLQCPTCAGRGEVYEPSIDVQCPICSGSGKVVLHIDTPWGPIRHGWGTCGVCKGSGRWRTEGSVKCPVCSGSRQGDLSRKLVESVETGNTFLVPTDGPPSRLPTTPPDSPPVVVPSPPTSPSDQGDSTTPPSSGGDGCHCRGRCHCRPCFPGPQHCPTERVRRCGARWRGLVPHSFCR